MDTQNKTWKLTPIDLDLLASYTDTPREDVEYMYKEFLEKSSNGKITKEGFKAFMGVSLIVMIAASLFELSIEFFRD